MTRHCEICGDYPELCGHDYLHGKLAEAADTLRRVEAVLADMRQQDNYTARLWAEELAEALNPSSSMSS